MEIRAVGIRPDGTLFGIKSADSVRGHRFMKVLVGVDQTVWYRDNKEIIDLTIKDVSDGEIVLLFDVFDEDLEESFEVKG